MLGVISFAYLPVVQAVITSLDVSFYNNTDCSGDSVESVEFCLWGIICDRMTCDDIDDLATVNLYPLECKNNGVQSSLGTCVDDGTSPPSCSDYDLCITECFGNSDTACQEPCIEYGLNMGNNGYVLNATGFVDCDDWCTATPHGFKYWGECFHNANAWGGYMVVGTTVTCNMAGYSNAGCTTSDGTNNTGMIIGIVVGAIVVVGLIVAVVMYLKKSKKGKL